MQLLLLSNSTNFGGTPLAHATDDISSFLSSRTVLFVPYALADLDAYTETIRAALKPTGSEVLGLHTAKNLRAAVTSAEALYVGGGNTFRLLATLQRLELLDAIRDRVAGGTPYMGASAGTNLACPTIRTTNDMPIVQPNGFTALGLLPFQVNAHYVDPDPSSQHMGETREKRIAEFHEENSAPVLGLREGAWLRREGDALRLCGNSARLFRRGSRPQEYASGQDLSRLLE